MLHCEVERVTKFRQDGRTEMRTTGEMWFSRIEPLPDILGSTDFWRHQGCDCPPGYQRVKQALRVDPFSRRLHFDLLDVEVI